MNKLEALTLLYSTIIIATSSFRIGEIHERRKYRPKGRWEKVKIMSFGLDTITRDVVGYQCPFCGRKEVREEPFCNCGADMRGDDHE